MASAAHLALRFLGSLRPGPPSPIDEAWVRAQLIDGERRIWERLSNPDRRHAVGVARAVVAELGPDTDRAVVAAALLHDCGKVISGYRTPARVAATLVWAVADHGRATDWLERGRPWRRLAHYRLHPELGAELLAEAGSDPLTVGWAADHHRPPDAWRVDARIGSVLSACDGD